MMPIGDDDSGRTGLPMVTYVLIAINVIVFLLELTGGDAMIQRWAFVPQRFMDDPVGDMPTVFTSMFMHAGWAHLLGNMLYLYMFGDNIESRFGPIRFVAFYLVAGIAAMAAQLAAGTDSVIPNLGASGAIAGVLGAYLVLIPNGRIRVLMRGGVTAMPAIVVIGFWFVLQLISGIGALTQTTSTGGVAYLAHVGGFVAGLALAMLSRGRPGTPSAQSGA